MSKWQRINDQDISIDGDDIEILINSDDEGNNYIVISLERVLELLPTPTKQEEK